MEFGQSSVRAGHFRGDVSVVAAGYVYVARQAEGEGGEDVERALEERRRRRRRKKRRRRRRMALILKLKMVLS